MTFKTIFIPKCTHQTPKRNEMKRHRSRIDRLCEKHHTNWSRDRANSFYTLLFFPSFFDQHRIFHFQPAGLLACLLVCLFCWWISFIYSPSILVYWWLGSEASDEFSFLVSIFFSSFVCKRLRSIILIFILLFFFGKIVCSVYDSDWLCWCVDRFYLIEYKYKTMK